MDEQQISLHEQRNIRITTLIRKHKLSADLLKFNEQETLLKAEQASKRGYDNYTQEHIDTYYTNILNELANKKRIAEEELHQMISTNQMTVMSPDGSSGVMVSDHHTIPHWFMEWEYRKDEKAREEREEREAMENRRNPFGP